MRAFAVLAMLSTLVAVAALVAHVTVVRVEKRKASLRTFTIAAYLTGELGLAFITPAHDNTASLKISLSHVLIVLTWKIIIK